VSDEQARLLDLEVVEERARRHYMDPDTFATMTWLAFEMDVPALIAECRALRAERDEWIAGRHRSQDAHERTLARMEHVVTERDQVRTDLAAARSALEVAEDIVAIARRWADAETPSMAIRAAMDLRAALGQEQ
jgi:hypothetical protein